MVLIVVVVVVVVVMVQLFPTVGNSIAIVVVLIKPIYVVFWCLVSW